MGSLSELFQDEIKNRSRDIPSAEKPTENDKTESGTKKVLFICTGNSVRSQIADAFLKNLGGDNFEVYSAGVTPAGVHNLTKQVMGEIGISMEGYRSNHVEEYKNIAFDYVIPLCEVAALSCPEFPGKHERINWYIDDPIRIIGDENRKLMAFRITRKIIKKKVSEFIKQVT
jgi:arsenate reductase